MYANTINDKSQGDEKADVQVKSFAVPFSDVP